MRVLFFAFTVAALFLSNAALARERLTLAAEEIEFSKGFSLLTATGNVEMRGPRSFIRAKRIEFDRNSGIVTVLGPLTFVSEDQSVVVAEYAELSSDLREGILKDARLLLDKRVQFTAAELIKEREGYRLRKAYGSPCTLCNPGETPTWSIDADEVESGDAVERIVLRNAVFRVMGIPIAFVPWLSMPGPNVERADGVLPLEFVRTSAIGNKFALPYFKTLGDHADLTVTPFFTTRSGSGLEFENRIVSSKGKIKFSGSIADGRTIDEDYRAWISAEGNWRLTDSLKLSHSNQVVSDNQFLSEFAYSQKNRIENRFALVHRSRRSRVQTDLFHFRSLTDPMANRTMPTLIGRTFLNFRFEQLEIGGSADLELSATALEREQGTDRLAAGARFGWSRSWIASNGVEFTSEFSGTAVAYNYGGEASGSQFKTGKSVGFKLRWPWIKRESSVFETLEPVAQFVWSSQSDPVVENEDSKLLELDETNLLLANRFSSHDRSETGARLNLGLIYNRHSAAGSELEMFVGRIIRRDAQHDFSPSSGLNGRNSDYVVATELKTANFLKLKGRALFDDALEISRADFGVRVVRSGITLNGGYSWFAPDPLISTSEFSEYYSLDLRYELTPRWSIRADWKFDGAIGTPINEEIVVANAKDCAGFEFGIARRFRSMFDNAPVTSIKIN
ncbi:MAG: LPS assembly protein LptD, partial [Albidovulum sp.]|nr:LPS assembly protein LptD [Albidovulum sp.]